MFYDIVTKLVNAELFYKLRFGWDPTQGSHDQLRGDIITNWGLSKYVLVYYGVYHLDL